jgi:hypothetical protein
MLHDLYQAVVIMLAVVCTTNGVNAGDARVLNGRLQKYLDNRKAEFDQIPAERKETLKQVAEYIHRCASSGEPAKITFICTHNSRRSHMGQLWAVASAAYYGVGNVETFSGGTEATAFYGRPRERRSKRIGEPTTEVFSTKHWVFVEWAYPG